jgi:hypothetical protein
MVTRGKGLGVVRRRGERQECPDLCHVGGEPWISCDRQPRAQTRLSATGGLWVLSKLLDENELEGAVLSVFMVTIILTTKPVDSRGLKRTQEDSDSLKSK